MKDFFNTLNRAKFRQIFHLSAFPIIFLVSIAAAQWSTQSPIPTHLDLRGIAAPTAQRIFIATDDNPFDSSGALFESPDGGTSRTQRQVPFSLTSPLNGIFFHDSNHGWAFGNVNYRTVDGGLSWDASPASSPSVLSAIRSVSVLLTAVFTGRLTAEPSSPWYIPARLRP